MDYKENLYRESPQSGDSRSSHHQLVQAVQSRLEALRNWLLRFARGFGGIHNRAEIRRPECPNLGEADKVGNVLTISTSRCPACAHLSHVGLLCAAPKAIRSRGQT